MFLSSVQYSGALGGLSGADLRCLNLAKAAGVAGKFFRAWLSDGVSSPATRFQQTDLSGVPYILLTGEVVADDFLELVQDGPRTGVSVTELGAPMFGALAWTNTSAFGELFSPVDHCSSWLSASNAHYSRVGYNALMVEDGPIWQRWKDERFWTSFVSSSCDEPLHLDCFEDALEGGDE